MNVTAGYNKPASFETTVATVRKVLEKSGLGKIFLCADKEAIKEKMRKIFGDQVCHVDAVRSTDGQEGIHLQSKVGNVRENHWYLLDMEVLRVPTCYRGVNRLYVENRTLSM